MDPLALTYLLIAIVIVGAMAYARVLAKSLDSAKPELDHPEPSRPPETRSSASHGPRFSTAKRQVAGSGKAGTVHDKGARTFKVKRSALTGHIIGRSAVDVMAALVVSKNNRLK